MLAARPRLSRGAITRSDTERSRGNVNRYETRNGYAASHRLATVGVIAFVALGRTMVAKPIWNGVFGKSSFNGTPKNGEKFRASLCTVHLK